MFKFLVFVLIPINLIMIAVFIDELFQLYRQEKEEQKNIVREGMEGYLDQAFGFGTVKIFKSVFDAEGNESYLVYLPQYEWFKAPKYKWFEVYSKDNSFYHCEIEE